MASWWSEGEHRPWYPRIRTRRRPDLTADDSRSTDFFDLSRRDHPTPIRWCSARVHQRSEVLLRVNDTDRWFVTILELGRGCTIPVPSTGPSSLYIAVSTTDAHDRSRVTVLLQARRHNDGTRHSVPSDCPCFGDQPFVERIAYGFYVSTNEFTLRALRPGLQRRTDLRDGQGGRSAAGTMKRPADRGCAARVFLHDCDGHAVRAPAGDPAGRGVTVVCGERNRVSSSRR